MNNIVSPVYRMWNEVIKNREDIGMSIFIERTKIQVFLTGQIQILKTVFVSLK